MNPHKGGKKLKENHTYTYNNQSVEKSKIKNLEISLKEKKSHIIYRENCDLNDYSYLLRNHRGQKTVNGSFKVLKEKNCQHIILYPAKIY